MITVAKVGIAIATLSIDTARCICASFNVVILYERANERDQDKKREREKKKVHETKMHNERRRQNEKERGGEGEKARPEARGLPVCVPVPQDPEAISSI